MKLESDLPVLHPTAARIPNSKPLQQGNDIVDPTKFKSANKITDEKQEAFLCEVKGSRLMADSFPSEFNNEDGFWPVLDFECPIPPEDLTKEKGYGIVKAIKEDFRGETELLRRDSDIFNKKSVTEFEMLKVVVCCKDDCDYCETRDVCIDKVVIPDKKILFETNRNLLANEMVDSSLIHKQLEIRHPNPDAFEVPEDHCPMDPVGRCCPEHLVHSAESSATEDAQHDSSASHVNEVEQQSAEVLHDKSAAQSTSTSHASEEMNVRHEDAAKDSDTISVKSALPENCEVKRGISETDVISETNELPYGSQVVSGTITFSFAASTQTPNDCNGNKGSLNDQDGPKFNDGQANFCRDQHRHGESSFAILADPPSGLISYSGPIAYSGSLSLRSDSSIGTSTRSFAFPILQSEWSSSPVRMAEADRRVYRQLSGWKKLLCCKF